MENTEIKLVQAPVIEHKVKEAGAKVEARIAELNLENQIATVDTVQALKNLRAELNKELATFEEQRKVLKKAVTTPYDEFEALYKTEISEKYSKAIDKLKDKIAFVENDIKSKKQDTIKLYYNELCIAEKIDFITFEKLGLDINLSTSEKKYKEQIDTYIAKVIDDLNLIRSTDYEAEILTEYKTTLNASKAITTVKDRKEKEKQESARILAQRTAQRVALCKYNGMVFVDITNAYEYSGEIYVTTNQIETLENSDFTTLMATVEQAIRDDKARKQAEQAQQEPQPTEAPVVQKQIQQTPVAPLAPPTVEVKEEIVEASFTVTGTMTQLRSLGAYMKANNIIYKNIK